ncbi:hypothetical protein [Caballeronia sp. LZ035]|uniref:hypothetical protein n=1 Tax=Caballeronia sp. LZ035 TaxID=3038568 RepID=UPI00285C5DBE|nr:hypothetical protein [Caballeronia sp. LZ035]MDR5756969.1 hypothetical protein [Caballeronia sp. LZ035]
MRPDQPWQDAHEKTEAVRLSSNEGNNMKGARQRGPVRARRIFRMTLLASALYAVLGTPHAHAQNAGFALDGNRSDRFDRSVATPPKRFDGRMIRAQQRVSKGAPGAHDNQAPAMQSIQQVDQAPPARPPRHTVMTADERRLLRQHIEEAVRDLYKR